MNFLKLAPAGAAVLLAGCIDTEEDYVAVVGETRMALTEAALTVVAEGKGKTAAEATDQLVSRINTIREIAADFGSTDELISSAYFNLDRESVRRERPQGGFDFVDGDFIAAQWLRIRTRDVARAGEFLGVLVEADVEEVSPPEYLIDDTTALFERARELAMKDAQRRAALYVATTGQKLGGVEIIEESGTEPQRMNFNLRDRYVQRYTQEDVGGEASVSRPMMDTVVVTGSRVVFAKPEDISVTVSIYAKFELE